MQKEPNRTYVKSDVANGDLCLSQALAGWSVFDLVSLTLAREQASLHIERQESAQWLPTYLWVQKHA